MSHKKHSPLDDFFNRYRGRYSQEWAKRFGIIPNLPSTFDNSNDIYELMAWLQRGFKMLLDDFLNLELEFEEFKNAIIELLEELIPQLMREFIFSQEFYNRIFDIIRDFIETEEFKEKIFELIKEFMESEYFKDFINNLIGEWAETNLQDIYDRLDYLENLINSIVGQNYTQLTEGTDYTITFFNDYYYREGRPITIGIIESSDRYFIRIDCDNLRNLTLHNTRQEHNAGIENEPLSVIFGVNFIGDYANLANLSLVNSANNGSGIYNTRPNEIRASWQANYNVYQNYNGTDIAFVLRSYNDGYNTQFDVYGADIYLETGVFKYELTLLK